MIWEYLNRILRSFEVVTLVPHAFDNGKQFVIMNIIVTLCRYVLGRIKGNRVPIRITELKYRKSQGINIKVNWEIWIKMPQNKARCELVFQFIKCNLGMRWPVETLTFPEKRCNRLTNLWISMYELVVKIWEAKEYLSVMSRGRHRPFGDCFNSIRVYRYTFK